MFTILRCLLIVLGVMQPVNPQTIIFQDFPYTLTEEDTNVKVSTNSNRDEVTPTGQCFYDNNNDIKCIISWVLLRTTGNEDDVRHRIYNNQAQSLTGSKITHSLRKEIQGSPTVIATDNPAYFTIAYTNENTNGQNRFQTFWRLMRFSNGNGVNSESAFGDDINGDQLNPSFIRFIGNSGSIAIGCYEADQSATWKIYCKGKDFNDNTVINELIIDNISGEQRNVQIFQIPGFGFGATYEGTDPIDGNVYIYASVYQVDMNTYAITPIIQGQKLSDQLLLPNGQHFRPVAKYVDNRLIYAYDSGNMTNYDVFYEKYTFDNVTFTRLQGKVQVNDISANHDHQASIEVLPDLDLIVLCWNTYAYNLDCRDSILFSHAAKRSTNFTIN